MTNKIKMRGSFAVALVALFLAGCLQKSLEPFYTAKDVIAKPALAGVWAEPGEDDDAVWTFKATGEKRFLLTIAGEDETMEFDARVFRLGGREFLDLHSTERTIAGIPAHLLAGVSINEDQLLLRWLSLEWVKEWVEAHPKSISHLWVNDPDDADDVKKMEAVLTAKTPELQKFVLEHLDAEGFLEDEEKLVRKK